MKQLILLLMVLFAGFVSACSTDTHYDSISTEVTLRLPDMPYDGSTMKVRQRFQFDRDLDALSSVSLVEAWVSSPAPDLKWDEDRKNRLDASYSLDMLQSITLSLVESADQPSVFWMTIPATHLRGTDAMFSDFNVGDLRQFMDDYQQLEIEIELKLEPYYVMKYWRDVCEMAADCTLHIPVSMQFKMEE